MRVEAHIAGGAELKARLERLSKAASRKALDRAGQYAWEPMLRGARTQAPQGTGLLREALVIAKKGLRAGAFLHRVHVVKKEKAFSNLSLRKLVWEQPDGGTREILAKAAKKNPVKYLHLVTGGTRAHPIKVPWLNKPVQHPGHAPDNFLARVFQSQRGAAEDRYGKAVQAFVNQAWEGR